MIRLLVALALVFPATALAQAPVATPTAGIEDEDVTDPVDDEQPVEGDDAYTDGCSVAGTDADYVYCEAAGTGGPPPKRKDRPAVVAAQAVPAGTLPLTGGAPGLVAGFGLGLTLMGAGLRIAVRRSAVSSRSSVSWR